MTHSILFDPFVNVQPGEPYRLFPFGKIVKNGKTRKVTPAYASKIQLPHFKPAIKLGSHEDATPAGGHIVALEVRATGYETCELCQNGFAGKCKEHGLFCVPEFNESGLKALKDGAYRYHSPEIIWEGGLEDPNGGAINAPLIVGDALLHAPHLGESAALYEIEEITQENTMNGENFTLPKSLWETYIAPLLAKPAEKVEVVKVVEPEDYTAIKGEVEKYRAEAEQLKAQAERKARVEKYESEIKETKADPTLADLLADLAPEKAELVMRQFKALSAQIVEERVTGEQGVPADAALTGDPKAAFHAAVLNIAKEKNINYNAAFAQAREAHADLFKAWAK